MSMTPSTPQLSLKTFWQRPEGKTGTIVLLATGVAGLYGFSLILPWLMILAANTLYFGAECAVLLGIIYVVTNKTFRNNLKNAFQSIMRWSTGLLISIAPIDILENSVDDMEEKKLELDKALEGCSGAREQVKAQMDKNTEVIRHETSLKEQADKQLAKANDPLEKQRYALSANLHLQEIGRRIHSNEKFQATFDQTTKLYNILTRWQQLADFNIENTKAQVQNAKAERTTILASYKGMKFAQRILKGDPEQLKLLNQDLEYLVQDNAEKLGEMAEFSRYSEKFLTDMDLESGAAAGDAEKMLAQYEQKLLTASKSDSITPQQVSSPTATSTKGYLD